MSEFLLTDIKGRLEDAKGCLKDALWDIESCADDPEQVEKIFEADGDLKALYGWLGELQKAIDAVWTPALKARLQQEQEEQGRLEDLADASSY